MKRIRLVLPSREKLISENIILVFTSGLLKKIVVYFQNVGISECAFNHTLQYSCTGEVGEGEKL